MTYTVTIGFLSGKRWSKRGLSCASAIELKAWFIEHVPAAIWGSSEPEGGAR